MDTKIEDKYQAKCPKCFSPIIGMFLLKGTLYTRDWVVVKVFICSHCKNPIHWGEKN